MYCPIPFDSGRTDDDTAAVLWKHDNKQLVMNISCYGTVSVNGGYLAGHPLRGSDSKKFESFEEGWKWLCKTP